MTVRVAVTGASGFIGRHVLQALLRSNASVVAATRDTSKLRDLEGLVEVVQLDLASQHGNTLELLGNPDVLVHLAWGGLPNYNSAHHFEEELPRQYEFLRKTIAEGLKDLVVVGTCYEYGMQPGRLHEGLVCNPVTCYGFAKYALLRQLELLKTQTEFKLVWPRLFYAFGTGQSPSSLWSQLQAALQRNDAVFNMSAGEQLRDFLPVEKVADYLASLSLKRADLGPVNICSGTPVSIRALVERWLTEANRNISLNLGHYPYPEYEPMAFWGSPEKLYEAIGR